MVTHDIVDSSNSEAAILTGKGNVIAADIDIVGGTSTTNTGRFIGTIDHQEAPTPDPLAPPSQSHLPASGPL